MQTLLEAQMEASMIPQLSFCWPTNPISCKQWQYLMPIWTVGMSFWTTVAVASKCLSNEYRDVKLLCMSGVPNRCTCLKGKSSKSVILLCPEPEMGEHWTIFKKPLRYFVFPMQRASFLFNVTNFVGNHIFLNTNVTHCFLTKVQILQVFLIYVFFLDCNWYYMS